MKTCSQNDLYFYNIKQVTDQTIHSTDISHRERFQRRAQKVVLYMYTSFYITHKQLLDLKLHHLLFILEKFSPIQYRLLYFLLSHMNT